MLTLALKPMESSVRKRRLSRTYVIFSFPYGQPLVEKEKIKSWVLRFHHNGFVFGRKETSTSAS